MNLANQPTLEKAAVNGTEYRLVDSGVEDWTVSCNGCVAGNNEPLCDLMPMSCVNKPGTIWLKIA